MPLTPLFPARDQAITMEQGNTGDCYLLAALDCIFNAGAAERQRIESMFKQRQDGSVEVRIPHGQFSKNLVGRPIGGKFNYRYDPLTKQDVFVLSKERVKAIDDGGEPDKPVTSNSLAVKIIERLTSYYYDNVDDVYGMKSISQHNHNESLIGSEIPFLAHLFGTTIIDTSSFEAVTHFVNPPKPIYIAMNYGQPDAFGTYHGRHALRLQKVEPVTAKPGFFRFTLVNPWDNSKTEKIEMDKAAFTRTRKCKCSIFRFQSQKPDSQKSCDIAELPGGQALLSSLEMGSVMEPQIYQHVIRLYRQLPWIGEYLSKLVDSKKRYEVLLSIYRERGDATSWWAKRKDEVTKFYKAHAPSKVLPTIVNKETTFETALLAAMNEYQQKHKCNSSTAKKAIMNGIFAYHSTSSLESISECGGLRELFANQIFNKSHINLLFMRKSKACLDFTKKFNTDYTDIEFGVVIEKRDSLIALLKQELDKIAGGFFNGYASLNPAVAAALLTKIEEICKNSDIKLKKALETDEQNLQEVIGPYKEKYQHAYSHAFALQKKLCCIGNFFKDCKDVQQLLEKMNTPQLDLDDFIDLLNFSELVSFTNIYMSTHPRNRIPVARDHSQSLEIVVKQAILQNSLRGNRNAKQEVESGLHQYFLTNEITYLTKSANLRNCFISGLFTKQSITERLIASSLAKITAMPISFARFNTQDAVKMHTKILISELDTLIDNGAKEHEKVKVAKQNKIIEIGRCSGVRIQQLDNETLFLKIGLKPHLTSITSKALELRDKSKKDTAYTTASEKADRLDCALTNATKTFLSGESTPAIFKRACEGAINDASTELSHHRGWKSALYNALFCLATLGFGALYHRTFTPLKIKTNSEERIDALMKVVAAISTR